jgi:hypothetical protein
MSTLETESPILNVPDPSIVGPKPDEIVLRQGTFDNVNTTNLNGGPAVGAFVFADTVQTLTNKTLEAATTSFGGVAPTSTIKFAETGTAGTTATIAFSQTADRQYVVPNVGADCQLVLTEGTQTVNGTKTFTDLQMTTLAIDTINEQTLDAGVTVNNVRIAEDILGFIPATVDSMQATGLAAQISMAIVPKNTGAIMANIPDNLVTGGSLRGQYSVDWQRARNLNSQVANGVYSVVPGGYGNTAQSDYSFAAGRFSNAQHQGTFVLSDSTNALHTSTLQDQLCLRFNGGEIFTGGTRSTNGRKLLKSNLNGNTLGLATIELGRITMLNNTVAMVNTKVCGVSNLGNSFYVKKSMKVCQFGGVTTNGTWFNLWDDIDPAIAGVDITYAVIGADYVIYANGIAGQNITWGGIMSWVQTTL